MSFAFYKLNISSPPSTHKKVLMLSWDSICPRKDIGGAQDGRTFPFLKINILGMVLLGVLMFFERKDPHCSAAPYSFPEAEGIPSNIPSVFQSCWVGTLTLSGVTLPLPLQPEAKELKLRSVRRRKTAWREVESCMHTQEHPF